MTASLDTNVPSPPGAGSPEVGRHRSPLGSWTLARWTPPDLAGLVEGVWCFEGTLELLRERHFPLGTLELIVHLGPVYGHVEGPRVQPFPRSCFSGLLLGPDVIEAPPGSSSVLGIRLRPAGAYRLLQRPLHDLVGTTVELGDVLPERTAPLEDRCEAAGSPADRVRAAVGWLREGLGPAPDSGVLWALRRIREREGAVSIGALRERTGWHRAKFTTLFREQVGVTPKRFARLQRFRRALGMVRSGGAPLVDVALACGYSDQAHFNREFRELSGFAPGEYGARQKFPESASVAEATG